MLAIDARGVNDAWHQAKLFLNERGVPRPSRNGPTLEVPEPVATVYRCPTERVLFDVRRDCNPTFHFMEALWMLAGRNDVAWIAQFNSRIANYSDEGKVFHGAYGHRWRKYFDLEGGADEDFPDQIVKVADILRHDPESRRAVIGMWDPRADLWSPRETAESDFGTPKDIPCNDLIFFKVREGALQMTVCCRSNDIVWGCYGSNQVHFGMLQELMAAMIGVNVGSYTQISDSWHAYTSNWEQYGGADTSYAPRDLYAEGLIKPYPMVDNPDAWDNDLDYWMCGMELDDGLKPDEPTQFINPFFYQVATPMWNAWFSYKAKQYYDAVQFADSIAATDWRLACAEWLQRRIAAKASKAVEVTA